MKNEMIKKITRKGMAIAMAAFMMAACLTSCNDGVPKEPTLSDWSADRNYHWLENKKGEEVNKSAHEFGEKGCEVCGVFVHVNSNLTYVTRKNENDHVILSALYDETKGAGGEPLAYIVTEFTYDENGDPVSSVSVDRGVIYEECEYSKGVRKGEEVSYRSKLTRYRGNGQLEGVYTYDVMTSITSSIRYDEDGKMTLNQTYENSYSDNGEISLIKTYEGGKLKREEYYTFNERYGYISKEIIYNDDGTTTVNKYDG